MPAALRFEPGVPSARTARRGPFRFPRPVRRVPLLSLLLYYAVLIGTWFGVNALLPPADRALLSPLRSGGDFVGAPGLPRPIMALLAVTGAFLLVLPVAGVYMRTRRLRYDPSIVHTLVVLPVVAAGILLVVENSLARAFSLAGIVAAIRFRNTLPDARDIVYVLLALGIGLAAGGMALDVAVIMSGFFNILALLLWGYNVGSIYAAGSARQGILSVGERALLVGTTPAARGMLRRRVLEEVRGIRPDGLLLLHTSYGEAAESMAEEVFFGDTREWRLVGEICARRGVQTVGYLVRLKRTSSPADLLADLDECSVQILAAEYLPLSREVLDRHRHDRHHKHGHDGRGAHDAALAAAGS
jgi:hypothetical protein